VPNVVIDTSVFIAGMLTSNKESSSAQVISMWRAGAFTLVMSPQILREIVAKQIEKKVDDQLIIEFVTIVAKIALHIPGAYESTKLDNIDKDDNKFLAAAYEADADYLVSLDAKHLLPLKFFHGTQILAPHLFVRAMVSSPPEETERK